MAHLSRGKRLVSLSLEKIKHQNDEDTPTRRKVAKWLQKNGEEEHETDYSMDEDNDYVPQSVETSSDSCLSETIPVEIDALSTLKQNRHTEVSHPLAGTVTGDMVKADKIDEAEAHKVNVTEIIQDKGAAANTNHMKETDTCDLTNKDQGAMRNNPKKPLRTCKFCNEWQTHLKRHIVRRHKMEKEVIEALKLPMKEQATTFACMRKNGIYQQNILLAEKGSELIRERRQVSSATIMCSGCKGFYNKKTLFKHKRICYKSDSNNPIGVNIQVPSENALSLELSKEFTEQVLNRFRNDEVGQLCRNDFLTLLLGKRAWAKSAKKERNVIMSEMRLFAHLIIAFREQSENQTASGTDILDYSKMDTLEKAILKLCDNKEETKNGLKVRLGFLLKRAVKVIRGYYITKGKFKEEEAMTKFLEALHLHWDFIFYKAQVHCESRREGLRKPCAMPDNDDVEALRSYTVSEMNSMLSFSYEFWDDNLFVKLRNLIVCRVTLFNARRSGEPARLTLREWADANCNAWVDPELSEQINDPQEQLLLKDMKLAYQAGKGSRKLVPVLFPKDTLEPISKLLIERTNCNIHSDNIYLFPNTQNSLDHASGYHCLKAVVKQIPNLKKPHLLIADKFRHLLSTVFASLELPKDQQNSFIRHMGHSEAINRNVYQCPMAIQEITRVGKMLSNVDNHTAGGNQQRSVSVAFENSENHESSLSVAMENPENLESERSMTIAMKNSENLQSSVYVKNRRYTKWNLGDTELVKSHFNKFIVDTTSNGTLPSKSEVMEFLSKHEILIGSESENKYQLVRTKIFNEKKKFRAAFKGH